MIVTTQTIRRKGDQYEIEVSTITDNTVNRCEKMTLTGKQVLKRVKNPGWNLIEVVTLSHSYKAYQRVIENNLDYDSLRLMTAQDLKAGVLIWERGTAPDLLLRILDFSNDAFLFYIDDFYSKIEPDKAIYRVIEYDNQRITVMDKNDRNHLPIAKDYGMFCVIDEGRFNARE